MSAEITFILEPDFGRVTLEASQASGNVVRQIKEDLGVGKNVNCARPPISEQSAKKQVQNEQFAKECLDNSNAVYLFRLYHYSTVDGPGRRSVVQLAGCSIRCPGCYVPETHDRANGTLTSIKSIVNEIGVKQREHDGVTILGGEPFDQLENLENLVTRLKQANLHVTLYTGYLLEKLIERDSVMVNQILSKTDLLIDGSFERSLTKNAGEYRGSSNQRLISDPLSFSGKRALT